MSIKAVIFDLDGVIVTTDECHYRAWKSIAEDEGIYFDRSINERLRGISRMASLDIVLEKAVKVYTDDEKRALAKRKNDIYTELIQHLTEDDILPGVMENLESLRRLGIRIAVASSSKNTPIILKRIGLDKYFDAVSDGSNISKSKPDPEVFIKAADMLGIEYDACMIVEDAEAGILAGKAAGMKTMGINHAKGGDYYFNSLEDVKLADL